MKAVEFVKKFGWDAAKNKADELKIIESMGDKLSFEDEYLKRLVDSHELVECYGGIAKSRIKVQGNRLSYKKTAILWEGIIDVESCK